MRAPAKRASVTIIALCQVAAMALWFSASAAVPALPVPPPRAETAPTTSTP